MFLISRGKTLQIISDWFGLLKPVLVQMSAGSTPVHQCADHTAVRSVCKDQSRLAWGCYESKWTSCKSLFVDLHHSVYGLMSPVSSRSGSENILAFVLCIALYPCLVPQSGTAACRKGITLGNATAWILISQTLGGRGSHYIAGSSLQTVPR